MGRAFLPDQSSTLIMSPRLRLEKISTQIKDALTHRGYRNYVKRILLEKSGYQFTSWSRIEQQRDWMDFLVTQNLDTKDTLEISASESSVWRDLGYRSYTEVQFPDFDICRMKLDRSFDFVIADNVFEHLEEPDEAAKNVHTMLKHGGYFLISTPFFIRIHGYPYDYTRWTPDGLRSLLLRCGFGDNMIRVKSWGNRACIRSYLRDTGWPEFGWYRPLHNEPMFPVIVWALAQK